MGDCRRSSAPYHFAERRAAARGASDAWRGPGARRLRFAPSGTVRYAHGNDGRDREKGMKLDGGCYCGEVRYVAEGEPMLKAQCHCRECQYISGGAPNMFLLMPPAGFTYIKGTPKRFARRDLEGAVTREKALQRNMAQHVRFQFRGKPRRHVGVDEARRHGIHRDIAAGHLLRQGFGQSDQARFRRD